MSIKEYENLSEGVSRARILNADELYSADGILSLFEAYRSRSVILNNRFADDVWTLTNETSDVRLALSFAESAFVASTWLGCGADEYRDCAKAYVILHLGALQLATLRQLVRLFNRIGGMGAEEASAIVRDAHHALALLKLLPGRSEYRDSVMEAIEERNGQSKTNRRGKRQRALAEFGVYLQFSETLEAFWQTANQGQKLFYFPVYFWWNLTAILPMRVTEFLLTPRDCLEGNILTVRRTKLKGGGVPIAYRISEDYEYCRYSVSDRLAGEIRWYLRETGHMRGTDLDTLLLLEPRNARAGVNAPTHSRYFSYDDLSDTLRCFYGETISGQNAGIQPIRLGDTRHLAMISIIISGGSPVICRELAGHADINISSHYYANISAFVECVTLDRFRRSRGGAAEFSGANRYPATLPASAHRVTGGFCDALSFESGDVGECLKTISGDGRIGDCESCVHFWSDNQGVRLRFHDSGTAKKLVDMDSQHLIRMIDLARRGMGCQEDIGAAILRLQHSCHRLSGSLAEKYMNGEAK
jgi:hypothetical protein